MHCHCMSLIINRNAISQGAIPMQKSGSIIGAEAGLFLVATPGERTMHCSSIISILEVKEWV